MSLIYLGCIVSFALIIISGPHKEECKCTDSKEVKQVVEKVETNQDGIKNKRIR